ncbi:SDR family NAD(P)-dependent oxidoreductase [Beijerinckia sp. L45]|uniref:SDR family NAD(P)-dependent oxidoreductase n=1 Tax=Beijerinckia sp. L45 TaxID=1641855 RepID=UPI00131DA183|nr:SDR family NAD(P)-dependent oxidoreductase [Beijerinckia sp. L45]
MTNASRTAIIIGASRGLGLGLAEAYLDLGWRVIATRRNASNGALDALKQKHGARLDLADLDVTDDAGIAALRQRLASETLDLLFVSAGINIDSKLPVSAVSLATFTAVMTTNALAPMRIIEAFVDLVPARGVIAAMTSGLGSVAANTTGGYEVYRASKAALNTLLRSFSARNPRRAIVAMHPGWVRTDMGGAGAAISIDRSVEGMVNVLAAQLGKPGCVFLDYQGKTLPW